MERFEKAGELAVALYCVLIDGLQAEQRTMFGCPCAFKNGNMFFGVFARRLFFRLDEDERAALLASNGRLRAFEPVQGRPMREYLEIEARAGDDTLCKSLVRASYDYASGLPPKAKKPPAQRKKKS